MIVDPSPVVKKGSKSPAKKVAQQIDTIADDVRKIKESLKKEPKPAGRKSRQPAAESATPKGRPRGSKKAVEVEAKEEKALKIEPVNELKNELLADWLEDDEDVIAEKEKVEGKIK